MSIPSSTAGPVGNHTDGSVKNESQVQPGKQQASIFGRMLTWFSDLFSNKASNETKECFLVAIFKSIVSYINPWSNTTVKTASAEEGNRADQTMVKTALDSHQTNSPLSAQVTNSDEKEVGNTPKPPSLTDQIKKLEKEIKRLQNQIREIYTALLDHKDNPTLYREKEKEYQQAKADAEANIKDKQKQLDDLNQAKQADLNEKNNATPKKTGKN